MIWGWDPSPKTILESDEGEDRQQPFVWKSWALSPIAPGSQTPIWDGVNQTHQIWTIPGSKIYPTVNRLKKNVRRVAWMSKRHSGSTCRANSRCLVRKLLREDPFKGLFRADQRVLKRLDVAQVVNSSLFSPQIQVVCFASFGRVIKVLNLNIDSLVFSNCPGFWSQRQYLLVRVKYFVLMSSEFQLGLETFRKLFLRPCSE